MPVAGLIRLVFALLLLSAPAWAASTNISGTVSYRERIALPAGAQLRVSLVALPSGQPIAGASAPIPAQGEPPLAFSLNVHRNLSPGSYGLLAEIRHGGQALFSNADPVPVDPAAGHPIAILVGAVPPRPTPPLPVPPPGLIDGLWTVTSIGGAPPAGSRPVTLTIAPDLRTSGHGGCNNYFAEASFKGDTLSFGPAAATRMACDSALMAQENAYFAALDAIAGYELDGPRLRLLDAAGVPLIGLVREAE